MHKINTKKIVPYTAQQMYALVNAVESYPEFLSWCSQSVVHEKTEEELKATMVMSVSGFTQSLTTHNRMQKDKMIEIRLIDGPLKHLQSYWHFEDLTQEPNQPAQCQILFDIEFEFSNMFLRMALEPFFTKISDTIIDNFCARAETLYKTCSQ